MEHLSSAAKTPFSMFINNSKSQMCQNLSLLGKDTKGKKFFRFTKHRQSFQNELTSMYNKNYGHNLN